MQVDICVDSSVDWTFVWILAHFPIQRGCLHTISTSMFEDTLKVNVVLIVLSE